MTQIEIVNPEKVYVNPIGRPKGPSGKKYAKYIEAIRPLLHWINYQISISEDHTVRMSFSDLTKEMSDTNNFVDKNINTIYSGLKHALSLENIRVGTATSIQNEKVIVFSL